MMVEFDVSGILRRVVSFTLDGNDFSMFSVPQNLITSKDHSFFMVGALTGFLTQVQYDLNDESFQNNLDVFVFPMSLDEDRPTADCIPDREIRPEEIVPYG